MNSDLLTSKHQRELARLRSARSQTFLRKALRYSLFALAAIFTYFTVFSQGSDEAAFQRLRREVAVENQNWGRDLAARQLGYEKWLEAHGTSGEKEIFQIVNGAIFRNALSYARRSGAEAGTGTFGQLWIAAYYAIMRISFIVVACWRFWLIIAGIACYFGYKSRKVYQGPNFLGQTGNGRIFYSGIRAGLENLSKCGAPNLQVRGLACPRQAAPAKVNSSELGRILAEFGCDNETNKALSGILLEYEKWPAYVAQIDEDALLEKYFTSSSLPDNAVRILSKVLELHAYYVTPAAYSHLEKDLEQESKSDGKMTSEKYSIELQKALHRVVTPQMRSTIATVPAKQIATLVLGYEAGKIMAYANEGGKWLRKSNYTQLSARAVMHSVEAFAKEYDYEDRTLIRRALIFGARASAFGPVKTPVDLSEESRALRQWVEVLMACPYELETAANEVEMHGIICETHKKWEQVFMDAVMVADSDATEGVFGGSGNLLLLPFTKLMNLSKKCIDIKQLTRLEALAALVYQQQRLEALSSGSNSGDAPVIPAYAKVLPPFREDEIRTLSKNYSLSYQQLREWSTFRIVLNTFGWLARRVGDYSVSESSIIYAVMTAEQPHHSANVKGLIGVPGMVPIRATRLQERWGKFWASRFTPIIKATMAENIDNYQKLLRGESLDELEETSTVNA